MQTKATRRAVLLRPAGPAGPAAATIPTSLGGAHSHRAADPSDPGLTPWRNDKLTRPRTKNLLKNGNRSCTMKTVNPWHILKRPSVAPFQAPIDSQ